MSLESYHEKRDFSRTPEPSGAVRTAVGPAPRFVIQRHRARRLHYDFRLEIDGVLVSWAVPKGITLDPDGPAPRGARRGPSARLRAASKASSPSGEYGGGDVIVWDRGTWELHKDERRRRRGRRRASSTSSCTARSSRAASCSSARRRERRQGAVARPAQARRARGRRLGSRGPPALGAQRPHQRRGRGEPRPVWTRDDGEQSTDRRRRARGRDRRRARGARRAPGEGDVDGPGSRARADEPRQGAVPRARRRGSPSPSATSSATTRRSRRCCSPTSSDRPLNLHRFPDGVEQEGLLAEAGAEVRARLDHPVGQHRSRPGRERAVPRRRQHARARVAREPRRGRAAPVDVAHPRRPAADVRAHRPRSRAPRRRGTSCSRSARLHRTALEHLGVRGYPKVTGQRGIQIWIPIAAGPDVRRDPRAGSSSSPGRSARSPRSSSAGRWTKREREGRARLDYTQNAINKTLVAPYSPRPAPGAPVSVPITLGRARRPRPPARPLDDLHRARTPRRSAGSHGALHCRTRSDFRPSSDAIARFDCAARAGSPAEDQRPPIVPADSARDAPAERTDHGARLLAPRTPSRRRARGRVRTDAARRNALGTRPRRSRARGPGRRRRGREPRPRGHRRPRRMSRRTTRSWRAASWPAGCCRPRSRPGPRRSRRSLGKQGAPDDVVAVARSASRRSARLRDRRRALDRARRHPRAAHRARASARRAHCHARARGAATGRRSRARRGRVTGPTRRAPPSAPTNPPRVAAIAPTGAVPTLPPEPDSATDTVVRADHAAAADRARGRARRSAMC